MDKPISYFSYKTFCSYAYFIIVELKRTIYLRVVFLSGDRRLTQSKLFTELLSNATSETKLLYQQDGRKYKVWRLVRVGGFRSLNVLLMLHIGTGETEYGTNDRKIRAELNESCYPPLLASSLAKG